MEINPDFSFPLPAPTSGQVPSRSRSFGSRPGRVHAHRRSGAVSEDFDVRTSVKSTLVCPASPSALHKLPPSTPRSPETPFYGQSLHTMSASSLSSESTAVSEGLSRRLSFVGPPSPRRSPHLNDIGEPGPTSSHNDARIIPSKKTDNKEDDGGRRHKKHSKRNSFVKLFKRKSPSKGNTTPPSAQKSDANALRGSPSLAPPAAPPTVRFSPLVTPRHSYEMEPEPPSIDLNEALSSSFAHRRTQSLPSGLESPFSKGVAASNIGPVMEEEDGAEDDPFSSRQKRTSISSLGIAEPPSMPSAVPAQGVIRRSSSPRRHKKSRSVLERIFGHK